MSMKFPGGLKEILDGKHSTKDSQFYEGRQPQGLPTSMPGLPCGKSQPSQRGSDPSQEQASCDSGLQNFSVLVLGGSDPKGYMRRK